jgi:hypothetical protein
MKVQEHCLAHARKRHDQGCYLHRDHVSLHGKNCPDRSVHEQCSLARAKARSARWQPEAGFGKQALEDQGLRADRSINFLVEQHAEKL